MNALRAARVWGVLLTATACSAAVDSTDSGLSERSPSSTTSVVSSQSGGFEPGSLMEWTPIAIDGLPGEFGGGFQSGAQGADGTVVAVGTAFRSEDWTDTTGVAVVTRDLSTWEPHDVAGWGEMGGVVAGGPGFIAAGATCGTDSPDSNCAAAIWASENGIDWEVMSTTDEFLSRSDCPWEYCTMSVGILASDGARFVAVGTDGGGNAMWHSEDGVTWLRLDTPLTLDPDLFIAHVVGLPGGGFLLEASRGEPVYDDQGEWIDVRVGPALFTSDDGKIWAEVALPIADAYSILPSGLTVWAGGVLARFQSCDEQYECTAAALNSTDGGVTWEPVAGIPDFPGDKRISAFGTGLLLTGNEFDAATSSSEPVLVYTPDLATWITLAADRTVFSEGVHLNSILMLDDGRAVGIGVGDLPRRDLSGLYVWAPG